MNRSTQRADGAHSRFSDSSSSRANFAMHGLMVVCWALMLVLCLPCVAIAGSSGSGDHMSGIVTLTGNTDPNGSVVPGDTLTYTVTFTNDGTITLAGVQIALKTASASLTPSSATCPSVAVGATCTLVGTHAVTTADAMAGQIFINAIATNTTTPGNWDTGYVTAVTQSAGAAMVFAATSGDYVDVDHSGTITAGDTVQRIATAINVGTSTLTNVQIGQPNTAPATGGCASVAPGATCVLTSTYTFTAADIAAGQVNFSSSATSTQVPGPEVFTDNIVTSCGGGCDLTAGTFVKVSGDGQSGLPGSTLPTPLTAQLNGPSGAPIAGQAVRMIVVSGSGQTVTDQGVTNASGQISTALVLGATPGPVVVLFSLHGEDLLFTANAVAPATPPTFTIVSGNNQVLPLGTTSAPFVVQLMNNGSPVANAAINWSGSNVHLTSATSLTDANGKATNTATITASGAASVTATSSFPSPTGPLTVTFALNGDLTSISGLTPQQKAVAGALNNACPALGALANPTPAQQDLLAQCQALGAVAGSNPAQAANAIQQMIPANTLIQSNASVLVSTAQFDNIKARMEALRSGAHGASFAGLAFMSPDGSLALGSYGNTALGLNDASKSDAAGSGFSRWGFFVSGSFGWGSADPRSVTPGYGFHTNGLTAGVDYRVNDNWVVGASAGYARYSSAVDAVGGGLDTHGWSLSGYTTLYQKDDWYVDGVLTWGSTSYDINRRIIYLLGPLSVNQTATSNSGGNTFAAALTVGKDFHNGPWSFGPYFRGQYSHTSFDGYQESIVGVGPGSGLGLNVQARSLTSVETVLGAKLNFASSQSWGVMSPHAEVEWVHEYENSPDSINASFLADPTNSVFQIQGDSVDSNYFRLGLGVAFTFTQSRSGFIYYEKTLGVTGLNQNNLTLGFRMEF